MQTSGNSAWIVDQDGLAAIDANTGLFRKDARSWWSARNDGNSVTEGGAARRITNPDGRKLYTNAQGNTLSEIKTGNTALTAEMLGAAASGEERANLISYIRGYDSNDSKVVREAMGDPIHATPSVVSYGCATTNSDGTCTSERQTAIVGTNEGFVQLFDTNTGDEQSAFMPRELLPNIKRLRANASMGNNAHVYGMDNSVTVWANDADGNGSISGTGEFAYAYASMGRGGSSLYALNVTNPSAPSLLWSIQGGSTGFSRMGQTWSAPVRAKIKVNGTATDVLIFGGGYDPQQDTATTRTADRQGNDVYVVNAKTGALLWSASSAGINMQYSVPSKVKVTTLGANSSGTPQLNAEGLAEQFFVGDMGGQVWRFRINNGSSGTGLVSGSLFASVGGSGVADNRRFYHEPELALVAVDNKLNLTVNIGSGFRGHPLDKNIEDRFYSFRTDKLDADATSPLTESDLYDGTALVKATTEQRDVLLEKAGWYIRLARTGEKVMSNALAIEGALYFNTYEPKAEQSACNATQGISYAYRVNLLDGTAINASRYTVTKGASLPSNPQLFCQGDTCYAYNDPSQLTNVGNGGGNGDKDKCDGDSACAYDVSAKARLYWTDEEED